MTSSPARGPRPAAYEPLRATLTARLERRLRDLPWTVADVLDTLVPGTFAELSRHVRPYSMCSTARLRGLYRAVRHAVRKNVPGDLVECGTARGGSAALMALTLHRFGAHRRLWVFDTFEGLPPPSDADPDRALAEHLVGACRGELHEVEDLFRRLGIRDAATFVKGLFQETLPTAPVGAIAVLHLDGDWYESVMTCLEHLYHRVSPGGIVQIDDYGHWAGARKATQEFLGRHAPSVRLRYVDYTGRQFTRPAPPS